MHRTDGEDDLDSPRRLGHTVRRRPEAGQLATVDGDDARIPGPGNPVVRVALEFAAFLAECARPPQEHFLVRGVVRGAYARGREREPLRGYPPSAPGRRPPPISSYHAHRSGNPGLSKASGSSSRGGAGGCRVEAPTGAARTARRRRWSAGTRDGRGRRPPSPGSRSREHGRRRSGASRPANVGQGIRRSRQYGPVAPEALETATPPTDVCQTLTAEIRSMTASPGTSTASGTIPSNLPPMNVPTTDPAAITNRNTRFRPRTAKLGWRLSLKFRLVLTPSSGRCDRRP